MMALNTWKSMQWVDSLCLPVILQSQILCSVLWESTPLLITLSVHQFRLGEKLCRFIKPKTVLECRITFRNSEKIHLCVEKNQISTCMRTFYESNVKSL